MPGLRRHLRRTAAPLGLAFLFLALRLPSFFEPTWYSDEGTYVNIGWALNHGARLYVDVWDNKPPGIYWLVALVIAHVPPALAMSLMASLLTAIIAAAVWAIAARLADTKMATLATAAYLVVASLPFLHGDLFNAELCGAAGTAVAVALLVHRQNVPAVFAAGVLVGTAVISKAVFAMDVLAAAGIAVVVAGSGSEKRLFPWRQVLAFATGVLVVIAGVAAVLAMQGVMDAALAVVTTADSNYVATYGSKGVSGVTALGLTTIRILLPALIGAIFSRRSRQHDDIAAAVLCWWAGWDVAGAMISSRGFPHYAQQAEPVLCLALALAVNRLWRRFHPHRWLRSGKYPVAATTAVAAVIAVLWLPSAEIAIATGPSLPGFAADGLALTQTPAYYINGYSKVFGGNSRPFDALFPTDMSQQQAAVITFDEYSRPGERVFVWGAIPWSYALAQRMPAARFVTLNSAYYLQPNNQDLLLADLEGNPPRVLIAEARPRPRGLLDYLAAHRYRRVFGPDSSLDYWLR